MKIEKTQSPKQKPDQKNLGFGKYFTDHMFIMDYEPDKGWYDPRIIPYQNLSISPAAMVFHYGQAIFEGLKAYRTESGVIQLFRPDKNMQRVNNSNVRLSIPQIDEAFCVECIKELVKIDADWVPSEESTSLYIRPFIIATDPYLGVRPSDTYMFIVILSPSGAYYPQGVNPVDIFVENRYVRAVRGGLGEAKTVANYAASLKAQVEAKDQGFVQVLWLDGVERKYIEEVGSMNVFFKINGEVITPALNGSILPGITRMSCIELLKSWGIKVTERQLSIDELFKVSEAGKLEEAFGTGTAAVISPIGKLSYDGKSININNGKTGEISKRLYDEIVGIQSGKIPDTRGWTVKI